MRGTTEVIVGLFTIITLTLVMGALLEPMTEVVLARDAVQSLGWASSAVDIRDTILRWTPLLGIFFFIAWAFLWAIRRERITKVRHR